MTRQQQHLPKMLLSFTGSSSSLPTFTGAGAEADENPSCAKAKAEAVRGKPEAQVPCLLSRRNVNIDRDISVQIISVAKKGLTPGSCRGDCSVV